MDTTPLDRFIIDANALDAHAYTEASVDRCITAAETMWETLPEPDREALRDLYRPAYFRLVVSILADAAHIVGDNPIAATRIRNHADRYKP